VNTELAKKRANVLTTGKGQELLAALFKQEPGWLDRPIEDVAQMVDLGSVWLQTQRMILKKIKPGDVQAARDFWQSRLEVARTGARGYFEGMKKIGEVRANASADHPGPIKKDSDMHITISKSKQTVMESIGVSPFTGRAAEWVFKNPDLVDVAFKEAKEKDDFPSLNDFLALAGKLNATGRRSRDKDKQLSVQQTADAIHKELLEINVLMNGIVEHLDQVKRETLKGIFDATRRLVEILTVKAPEEYRELGRGIE